MAPPPTHSRILEINIVSAEDLAPLSKNMKSYAVAWVDPDRKLATGVDQNGGTDTSWNDRFMFRVDDRFLNSEDATVSVEIYAAAWNYDALVGYADAKIYDVFKLRTSTGGGGNEKVNNSAKRTVTLQIRRPSGRPQGILNLELALVDSTKRSLPQLDEPNAYAKITRSKSDLTELTTTTEDNHNGPGKGSIINGGSIINDGSVCDAGSTVNKGNNGDSLVNGESFCSTDVGPSVSVVAAAIAKGMYKPPVHNQVVTKESWKLRQWTMKEREKDPERWRLMESPPRVALGRSSKGKRVRGGGGDGGGSCGTKLFSCFSNALGCQISVTYGGNGEKSYGHGSNKICHLSSVDDNYSQSLV